MRKPGVHFIGLPWPVRVAWWLSRMRKRYLWETVEEKIQRQLAEAMMKKMDEYCLELLLGEKNASTVRN